MHRVQIAVVITSLALFQDALAQGEGAKPVTAEPPSVRLAHPGEVHRPLIIEPGEYDCWTLLDTVADRLQRNFVLGETFEKVRPSPPMTIRHPIRIEDDKLESFAGQLLEFAGCFAVPMQSGERSGIWRILRFDGPRRGEFMESARFLEPEQVLALGDDPSPVMTALVLEHTTASAFVNEARPVLMAMGGANQPSLMLGGSTNIVTIVGSADRVRNVILLAQRHDAKGAAPEVDAYEQRIRALEMRLAELEKRLATPASDRKD